jgi:prevent-host-death family protein
MTTVTIRDLRNHGGVVIDRVEAGESLIVTRSGKPVAELRPVRPPGAPTSLLLERWRRLPRIDPDMLRRDIDLTLDPSL